MNLEADNRKLGTHYAYHCLFQNARDCSWTSRKVMRTHTGCTECRRKKAKVSQQSIVVQISANNKKCDEKTPVCSRCTKYPRLCCYELIIKCIHPRKASATLVGPIWTEPEYFSLIMRYLANSCCLSFQKIAQNPLLPMR